MMKFVILLVAALALVQAEYLRPSLSLRRSRFVPISKPHSRITGGEEVTPHSIPYQVGLFIHADDGTYFCGGTLVSNQTVLTAAHCCELSNNIEVVLGAHKIDEPEAEQIRANSSEVYIHEHWNRFEMINDICLIRLTDAVTLNDNIQLVKLPPFANEDTTYEGDLATASGWGKETDNSTVKSAVLRKVEVPVESNGVCTVFYLGTIDNRHLCTATDGGKSTCQGDSGGPLVASTGEQIGITSFGSSFGCEAGWPAVFTRVSRYLDWIVDNSDVVIE